MAIDPVELRRQVGLFGDDLQLDAETIEAFNVNQQYHDLLEPHRWQLGRLMVGHEARYYEVGPQIRSDRSSFCALIAPQHRFSNIPWGGAPDEPAPAWRLVTMCDAPLSNGHTLRTTTNFIIDIPTDSTLKLAWEETSRQTVVNGAGKHVYPWESGCLPRIDRPRHERALPLARLTVNVSRAYERIPAKPSINVPAAMALSLSLSRFSDAFEVPIESLQFNWQS